MLLSHTRLIKGRPHIRLELIAIGQGIGHIEQSNNGHHLAQRFFIDAQLT